jgi:hypothetical protein
MTLQEFSARIDGYFEMCAAEGAYPDEAGMLLHVGIDRRTFDAYMRGNARAGYKKCLEDARLRRESIITREIYASKTSSTGKVFLLKQPGNGGLTEKDGGAAPSLTVEVVLGDAAERFE